MCKAHQYHGVFYTVSTPISGVCTVWLTDKMELTQLKLGVGTVKGPRFDILACVWEISTISTYKSIVGAIFRLQSWSILLLFWSFGYYVFAHKITFDYITTELLHFFLSTTSFLPGIRRQWRGRSTGERRREHGKREFFARWSFPSYPALRFKIPVQQPAEHSFPAIDWPTEPTTSGISC